MIPIEPQTLVRALWMSGPGRAEIRAQGLEGFATGQLSVQALQSGISRGTEALVFAGKVPESEWARMRCPFQEGDFPFPVKYGYAMVGRVEGGSAALLDRRVFCLFPHQTRFLLPEIAAIVVPDDVPTHRAVLAGQIETALNATWDAAPRIGDRIAVVGGGTIGCLVAWLCARMPETRVTLIDPNSTRAKVAKALGCGFAPPGTAEADCDLVFHASGTGDGLAFAVSLAGFEGEVIELSWYGTQPVTIPLGGAFHSQRLTLRSSQVGAVAPARRARWSHKRRLTLALSLAADPRLDVLVEKVTSFAHLPDALPEILGKPGALFHRVSYELE